MADEAVRMRHVTRRYGTGAGAVAALDDVTLDFGPGTFPPSWAPRGPGSRPCCSAPRAWTAPPPGRSRWVGGTELTGLDETRLTLLRRDRIGFVFQAFNLLPSLTAEQNVELPLRLAGRRPPPARVAEALQQVGLGPRAGHRPAELSGGQQQRVAPWPAR